MVSSFLSCDTGLLVQWEGWSVCELVGCQGEKLKNDMLETEAKSKQRIQWKSLYLEGISTKNIKALQLLD